MSSRQYFFLVYVNFIKNKKDKQESLLKVQGARTVTLGSQRDSEGRGGLTWEMRNNTAFEEL